MILTTTQYRAELQRQLDLLNMRIIQPPAQPIISIGTQMAFARWKIAHWAPVKGSRRGGGRRHNGYCRICWRNFRELQEQ